MKKQTMMFDDDDEYLPPWVRGSPPTSEAAARAMAGRAGTMRARVFELFVAAGLDGLTIEEAEDLTGDLHQSVGPRVWELCGKPRKKPMPVLLVDSGRTRKTRSGMDAVVWVCAHLARAEVAP